jgi:peroxiredoxin Q/BCP
MKAGTKAPGFSLKDKDGKTWKMEDIKADNLIVYFYPKDDTPGCTLQAKEYTKSLAALRKLKTEVVGISGGDEKTKQSFCKKHGLKVLLLSDPKFATAKKWGAFGEKTFMGKKFKGIFRNTYLLDKDRKVVAVFEKVKPEEDVAELIARVKTLGKKTVAVKAPVRKVVAKKLTTKKLETKKTTPVKTTKQIAKKVTNKAATKVAKKVAGRKTTKSAATKRAAK